MPIAYRVDRERRRVFFTISGEFSSADIVEAITLALTHQDFRPGFDIFSDHTAVSRVIQRDQIDVTTTVFKKFQTALAGARWAMVVGGSDYQWGMLRMLSGLASAVPIDARTFRDQAAALAWLDDTA